MNPSLDAVSLARRLIAFDTMNPPGQERACAEYLGKKLEEGGFETRLYDFADDRTSLVARIGGGSDRAPICFSGHIDTVPLGATPWTKDPFKGEVEGDRIYGRGAADMKGGVAAMVVACLSMARLPGGRAGMTLIITAGEETGCEGASFLAAHGAALDRAGALVVGEPTANYPVIGHKGALWVEARATGLAAHGSMPEKGINAIYRAADAVRKVREFDFEASPHPILGSPTANVGTISGGMNINSVPDQALIGIDIRTVPGQGNMKVFEKLTSCLGRDLEFNRLVDVEGFASDVRNEWIREVFDVMEQILAERPDPRGVTYFTDAAPLIPALGSPPTVILGPGNPEMAHKTDEWCLVSRIEEAVEAYQEIARRWCGL